MANLKSIVFDESGQPRRVLERITQDITATEPVSDTDLSNIRNAIGASGGGGGGGLAGSGSPEGVVAAAPGATYWDQVAHCLYVKHSGSGTTGWRELLA